MDEREGKRDEQSLSARHAHDRGDKIRLLLAPAQRRCMIEDMTVRNLSPAMQRSYISAVSSRYFGQSP